MSQPPVGCFLHIGHFFQETSGAAKQVEATPSNRSLEPGSKSSDAGVRWPGLLERWRGRVLFKGVRVQSEIDPRAAGIGFRKSSRRVALGLDKVPGTAHARDTPS
jgi:hypothetical protein